MEESKDIKYMQYFPVEDIDNIYNKISKNFKKNKRLTPYIDQKKKMRHNLFVNSGFANLDEDVNKILNNVVLSGAKGIVQAILKAIGNEHFIEVISLELGDFFNNEYIDYKEMFMYFVYANSMPIDFELRKKNI
ncbi:hypothetical protein BCR36DRAFT_369728 [Piromyces finnis]|uniref:Uncharacterized protein n=1 Tax=Piromyces finnis TaxID=1754191 RepID=A0A1Y1VB83_9FUNG|nr:hypothetical protein BCR36DRAFT_369728 [Piromyces finnis]|eukprot:ORX51820.1 hypothetical protein BCR36DRAFT_369728 [Piromyces finnis]